MQGHVLITGATGYIGRALCSGLAAEGWRVTGCCRRLPAPGAVPGVDWAAVGEIGPDTAWDSRLQGVDAVVHAASPPPTDEPPRDAPLERFRTVNLHGTRRLAEAAARAGVRHLVYLSSLKVHGESSAQPLREDSATAPRTAYALSKLEAEQALQEAAAASSLRVTRLRPPLVHGPGCGGFFRKLLWLCSSGLPLPLGSLPGRRSFLHLDNLASAVLACLARPDAADNAFLVADARPWPLPELLHRLCTALGRPDRTFPCPGPVLSGTARILGQEKLLDRLRLSLEADASRLATALGWTPPVNADEAMERTARDYLRGQHPRGS